MVGRTPTRAAEDNRRSLYVDRVISPLDGKLIYFDMEAFRDLELTAAVFERLVLEPDLLGVQAGIALQAYLPDTITAADRLVVVAHERVQAGGQPLWLRLVKGANLAAETVEASLHRWARGASDIDQLRVSRALALAGIRTVTQSIEEFLAHGSDWMFKRGTRRIRLIGKGSDPFYERASGFGLTVIADAVDDDPEVELRHYVQSQVISVAYHRYGNISLRGLNPLA